jgi:hypothetical protein
MNKEIWVADSETDPFKAGRIPAPFIWGAYNGSEYHQFDSTAEFVDFISEIDCVVYAHNGGKFDWHFLLDRLEEFEPLMVISGRLSKFKIGSAEFRDSYNILPFPLSAYKKDEMDYSIMEPDQRNKTENRAKIESYLKGDCRYLWDMVSQFIDSYGMHLTLAGAAMKTWQKIAETKAPQTTCDFYESLKPYYYGGRVECFETGIINHDFKVIDINSAYALAMKHLHPYGNTFEVSEELPKTRAYTERSFIKLYCISRGALPFRGPDGSEYPDDDIGRIYWVTGWEFLAASETGCLYNMEILEVITFGESIRFDDYIDHFYELKVDSKQKGDRRGYLYAKLFLTSLYGKFGANPDNYAEYTIVRPEYIQAAEQDNFYYDTDLGPWALLSRELPDEKRHYYNVAVAASVTGFVRAYLWRAIKQCSGVLYCDTDSIACVDSGELELDPENLGAWDIEAECDWGGIAGKKLYAFHTKTGEWKKASKGVRLTAEEIITVAKGMPVTYTPENPSFSVKRGIGFISRTITKKN